MTYRIESKIDGLVYGDYDAANARDALEAMLFETGCCESEDSKIENWIITEIEGEKK